MSEGSFPIRRGAPRALLSALMVALPLALAGTTVGCGSATGAGAKSAEGSKSPMVGQKAPDFQLPAQFGADSVSPSDADGKVLIVDFWATWCAPCKDSFPAYQKLLDKFGDKLVIIGVNQNDDLHPNAIKAFAKETGVQFPLAWDKGHTVANEYKPGTMPTSYIVDQNGIIRFVHAGFHAGDEKELEKQVKSLM